MVIIREVCSPYSRPEAHAATIFMLDVAGKRDKLIGRLQERYGIAKEEAENQVNLWSNDLTF